MTVILRSGTFGDYFGSILDSSSPCSNVQMQVNAKYIYSYLTSKGWTIESISAILGNMQAESSINPGRWQSDIVGASSMGYGLCQWTPATKYIEWAKEKGFNDYSIMDSNLARIVYEVENSIQWIATGNYSSMSFKDFTKSTNNVEDLAKAFLLCYERPADQSESVQNYRGSLAASWYSFLSGVSPSPNPSPTGKKKKNKFKFILFNKKRRGIYG